ncbi:hypothetical protein [Rhizobium sp. NXC24]|uniref:hypothetical protein n=1 Tax=Rhizobium sp. NXC24 TaxID=2048897 RepID=UPI000CF2EE39|nr:hypothetical protein [Rhizobium sp. NXC24]
MSLNDFVLAILVGEHHQATAPTLECLHEWRTSDAITVDLVVNRNSQLDYFTFLEQVRARHPSKHLLIMHADIYFAEDFLHRLLEQIALIEGAGLAWGLLGPAGVSYPYFKIVRNMVDHHGILYPFPHPLPAVHLDGHLLVIHKDLVLDFDKDYRGFHHYDTLLCIRSWAQGLPVFTINLPLRHLGQGNVTEWQERSEVLGRNLGKVYGNKTIVTSMGPVKLDVQPGVTRDFYKHEVEATLSRRFRHRTLPEVTLVMRCNDCDESDLREALLGICGQFEKPSRVIVICSERLRTSQQSTFEYFENFVDLLALSPDPTISVAAEDVLMGCKEAIRASLKSFGLVAFVDAKTTLFPNYVRDARQFHVLAIGVEDVVAAFDMNYAVFETNKDGCDLDARLVEGWRTETIEDLVSGAVLPLASFVMPIAILHSILDNHIRGALSERVFAFKLAARTRVFFLRRLGGFLRTNTAQLSSVAGPLAEVAMHGEFLRASYPFTYLWMKRHASASPVPVQAPSIGSAHISREQLLVMKLSQYPRLVGGIFMLHGLWKRLQRRSAAR